MVVRFFIVMSVASSLVFVSMTLVNVVVVSLAPVLGSVRNVSVRVRSVRSAEDIKQVRVAVRIVRCVCAKKIQIWTRR